MLEPRRLAAAIAAMPVYAVTFCVLFPLSIFAAAGDYYGWHGVLPASALLLALGLLIFWPCYQLVSDVNLAALASLAVLIALFPRSIALVPVFLLLVFAGAMFAVVRAWGRKKRLLADSTWLPNGFAHIANMIAIALVVAIGGRATYGYFQASREADQLTSARLASLRQTITTKPVSELPHIIHIVLDGYSRADILRSTYGFDNNPFLDALRQRGFHIADRATTPFNQTLFVMSSIFSLGPVTDAEHFDVSGDDNASHRNMLIRIMRRGAVPALLKELGYEMRTTPEAFSAVQLGTPMKPHGAEPLLGDLGFLTSYVLTYDMLQGSPALKALSSRVLGSYFDVVAVNYHYLKTVPERRFEPSGDRPMFVYQHILAPHPPFNITPDGKQRPLDGFPHILADNSTIIQRNAQKRDLYRSGYIDKLRYVNNAILKQIDELKASLPGPLIIVLHGDHGGGLYHEQDNKAETCLAERFSPLLAVYATDTAVLSEIDDDFNLVNLYRAIFRRILGADLPDLPRHSTFISWNLDQVAPVYEKELDATCPTPPRSSERVAQP